MEYTAIFRFISFLFVGKGDCVTIIDTQGMHDTENRTCVFTREIASMVKSLKGESQNFHERIARTSPNKWNCKSYHETLVASKMEKGDTLVVHSVVLQCYSLYEFSWLP